MVVMAGNQTDDNLDEESYLADNIDAENIGKRGMLIFDKKDNFQTDGNESSSSIEDAVSVSDVCSIASIPQDQMKIRFDILTSKIVNSSKGKYVSYVIMVMEVPKLDRDQAIIERRYSDFRTLHKELCKQCSKIVQKLPFPKKQYFSKNFDDSVIEYRSRQFERYLRYIYHQPDITESKAFRKFFYRIHLDEATQRLKCEEYTKSYNEYRLAYQLQKKLGFEQKELIATMCGLVETCKELKKYDEVNDIGSECLELIGNDLSNIYLLPLVHFVLDARKRLQLNTNELKDKMKYIRENTNFDTDIKYSLREPLVKLY